MPTRMRPRNPDAELLTKEAEPVKKSRARQIAIYGKGSIGKSTISCNLSAALAEMGLTVMQVGCSPKADSTAFLRGGEVMDNPVLEYSRAHGMDEKKIMDCIKKGYKGIYCAESGGPDPGAGCAGRGVAMALEWFKKYDIYDKLGVDIVIYDSIADVVCGGFGQPMKQGFAEEVYIVTSGELMSTYSANNICKAIKTVAEAGANTRACGFLVNLRGVEHEIELVTDFAERLGVPIMGIIPRSPLIQKAEAKGGTVVQMFPDSPEAKQYRELAKMVWENKNKYMPTPITLEEIIGLARKHKAFE